MINFNKLKSYFIFYSKLKYYNTFFVKYKHDIILNTKDETLVTPFKVQGNIDYNYLVSKFGTKYISDETIALFNKTFKTDHHWMSRKLFFTHRDFDTFLNNYISGNKVFLYTGRGPSSNSMHLGHLLPFMFTSYLQKIFNNCPVIIQIADEEKAAFSTAKEVSNKSVKYKDKFELIYKQGLENAKEIIAVGNFNSKNTFIFSNRKYRLESNDFELQATYMKNLVSINDIKKIFGFNDLDTMSVYEWPFYQAAASFSDSYKNLLYDNSYKNIKYNCLIPHAIDQDPYFRLTRDICAKLNQPKPSNIMCKFIPPLTSNSGKMSSSSFSNMSINMNCIFLNDSRSLIKKKIMNSYSGGGGDGTLIEHAKFGGNPDKDIAYKYLEIFETNDEKLKDIKNSFKSGKLSCSGIKEYLCNIIINLIESIQERKSKLTEEDVIKFYNTNRKLF